MQNCRASLELTLFDPALLDQVRDRPLAGGIKVALTNPVFRISSIEVMSLRDDSEFRIPKRHFFAFAFGSSILVGRHANSQIAGFLAGAVVSCGRETGRVERPARRLGAP
jgi:hypothetical protein